MNIPYRITLSIKGFNGSKFCDRTNPETFYETYMDRKRELAEKRLEIYKRGKPTNKVKLRDDINFYNFAKNNKETFINYIRDSLLITDSEMKEFEEVLNKG